MNPRRNRSRANGQRSPHRSRDRGQDDLERKERRVGDTYADVEFLVLAQHDGELRDSRRGRTMGASKVGDGRRGERMEECRRATRVYQLENGRDRRYEGPCPFS